MTKIIRWAAMGGALAVLVAACSGGGDLPGHLDFGDFDAELHRGSDHCGWDGTWIIEARDSRLGVETDGLFPAFVRDPSAISRFTYAGESDLDASLPSGATKRTEASSRSMLTSTTYELWFDSADQTRIYVVTDDRVEAWALATSYYPCA